MAPTGGSRGRTLTANGPRLVSGEPGKAASSATTIRNLKIRSENQKGATAQFKRDQGIWKGASTRSLLAGCSSP
jgi:hypothetical protein